MLKITEFISDFFVREDMNVIEKRVIERDSAIYDAIYSEFNDQDSLPETFEITHVQRILSRLMSQNQIVELSNSIIQEKMKRLKHAENWFLKPQYQSTIKKEGRDAKYLKHVQYTFVRYLWDKKIFTTEDLYRHHAKYMQNARIMPVMKQAQSPSVVSMGEIVTMLSKWEQTLADYKEKIKGLEQTVETLNQTNHSLQTKIEELEGNQKEPQSVMTPEEVQDMVAKQFPLLREHL
ncbi:hypothetical protein COW46_02940 [Candidatus Gracilibacteria bacterium CG17_big_fil_post_rev_8_21_14_2_50_48_13]|nr:MAG: hypothetical protein COW46_02940 [Candidatus Gracilibacteria bacterium CG17_big_fil_post_rev_8_21_14_2_50_48_13]